MNLRNLYCSKKNIFILTLILILILISSYLRFYKLTKTYSEYDENFMIALHKGAIEDKVLSLEVGPIKKEISIKLETLHNLEKTILLPFYIAYGSTYSPGQYAILPILLNDNDSYETIVKKNRSLAALASILTMILLLYLFYKIEKKTSVLSAFTLCIFGFSVNSIMYAHHGGVYSTYGLMNILGLILIYFSINKKISTYNAISLNTIFLYFSYLNIFFVLIYFYIEFTKNNFKKFFISFFLNKKKYLIFNLIILFPILLSLLLQDDHFFRGQSLPSIENLTDLILFFKILINQFYLSVKSLFSGFVPYISNLYFLFLFLLLIVASFNFLIKEKNKNEQILFISCIIYFSQWITLYCFNIIPLDQTRHILTFFPTILVIFYLSFKSLKINSVIYLMIILISAPLSFVNAKKAVEKNISLYDLSYLENQKEEFLLTYDSLQPLLYFEKKNKKIYFIKLNQFKKNYNKLNLPEKFLLVGHHKPFFNKIIENQFKNDFPKIYNKYKIETLIEKQTAENYLYNNYTSNANNGFFVYRFVKIK